MIQWFEWRFKYKKAERNKQLVGRKLIKSELWTVCWQTTKRIEAYESKHSLRATELCECSAYDHVESEREWERVGEKDEQSGWESE